MRVGGPCCFLLFLSLVSLPNIGSEKEEELGSLAESFLSVCPAFRQTFIQDLLCLPRCCTFILTTYLLPSMDMDTFSMWNMCACISWREIGQISSTSKGEISCRPPSSLTSEANTFSAKLRIASSISRRGFSHISQHSCPKAIQESLGIRHKD